MMTPAQPDCHQTTITMNPPMQTGGDRKHHSPRAVTTPHGIKKNINLNKVNLLELEMRNLDVSTIQHTNRWARRTCRTLRDPMDLRGGAWNSARQRCTNSKPNECWTLKNQKNKNRRQQNKIKNEPNQNVWQFIYVSNANNSRRHNVANDPTQWHHECPKWSHAPTNPIHTNNSATTKLQRTCEWIIETNPVSEMCSCRRKTREIGSVKKWNLGLTIETYQNGPWDFSCETDRDHVLKEFDINQPTLTMNLSVRAINFSTDEFALGKKTGNKTNDPNERCSETFRNAFTNPSRTTCNKQLCVCTNTRLGPMSARNKHDCIRERWRNYPNQIAMLHIWYDANA